MQEKEEWQILLERSKWVLWFVAIATGLGMTLQMTVSFISGSLALRSDAFHMGTDLIALAIFSVVLRIVQRPATRSFTFGFGRAEALGAFVSGCILLGIAAFIVFQAVGRIQNPVPIQSVLMLSAASVGFFINLVTIFIIYRGPASLAGESLRYHILSDSLSSVGIILGGLAVLILGWAIVDPIASLFVAVLIVRYGWHLVRKSSVILLEAAPAGFDPGVIEQAILQIPGVLGVHHMHVGVIGSGQTVFMAHVHVANDSMHAVEEIMHAVTKMLRHEFGMWETILQPGTEHEEGHYHTEHT